MPNWDLGLSPCHFLAQKVEVSGIGTTSHTHAHTHTHTHTHTHPFTTSELHHFPGSGAADGNVHVDGVCQRSSQTTARLLRVVCVCMHGISLTD